MNKTEYIACGKNKPPEDWTDYELPYIVVSEKKYDRWVKRCLSNKTNSSWLYFTNMNNIRRKVKYDKENEMLIYNGEFKGQWGGIVCDPTIKD